MQSVNSDKSKGRRKLFIVFIMLSVLWTAFIFSQSLKNAERSSATSGRVVAVVEKVLETVGVDVGDTGVITKDNITFLVRKTAHFLEFAILGTLAFFAGICILGDRRSFFSIVFPMAVAICDEVIQSFSPGRSTQLTDVLIDISGAAFATLLCFLFVKIYKQQRAGKVILDKTENNEIS